MKLNLKALSVALAILWAGAVFIVGVANLIWPAYGKTFLVGHRDFASYLHLSMQAN